MNHRYKIIDKSIVYDGFFQMEEYRLQHELFAGGWSEPMRRECLERGHAVAVLPYDPVHDQVILIEQFRVGALEASGGPWLLEIVAGIIGPNEAKPEVARREMQEEAGCELLDMVPIIEYLPSPGGSSETITLYCGRVDASGAGGIHGLPTEHEDIRAQVFSRAQALAMLRSGRVNTAAAIVALQWLELNRAELLARWGLDQTK